MTAKEFNDKYKDYIEEGFYGLEFDIPQVTAYLDTIFPAFTEIEGFMFAQIKLKFGMARFYADELSFEICNEVENHINFLIKELN